MALVNRAVSAGQTLALFLEGVPGSGKTALAKHISAANGWPLFRYDCSEESNSGLIVSFDLEGIIKQEAAYIRGPMWESFLQPAPSVLLIDEIDKSPRAFEAFLLRATDEQSFRAPGGETITARAPVVFVFTSNGRREMSPEFLRRCMRIKVSYPTGPILRRIIRKECPWGNPSDSLVEALASTTEIMLGKMPAELIPSPKELGWLASAITDADQADMETLIEGFFLKGQTLGQINQTLSFSITKRLWKSR